MLVYDQLIQAQLQNAAADLAVPSDGLVYFNTVTGFPKYYDSAQWREIADIDSPQIFTNKDYDGGTASNTSRITLPGASLATLQGLNRKAGTIWYANDTGSYYGDDGVNLSALGSGSGAGEINAIENSSASSAITGWVASGAGITVARTSTTSDLPLYPVIDSAIKITPVSGTDYVYYRFTMPAGLLNTKLKWEWFQLPLAGYLDGDLKAEIYTNTASNYGGTYAELPLSTDSSGDSFVPNFSGKFTSYFDADGSLYYEIRYVRVSGTTAINLTNVIVGPGIQPVGGIVTEWEPVTLVTDNFGTISFDEFFMRRVGSSMQIRGSMSAGAVVANLAAITLPGGLHVNFAYTPDSNTNKRAKLGNYNATQIASVAIGTADTIGVIIAAESLDSTKVYFSKSMESDTGNDINVPQNASALGGSGFKLEIDMEVPIAEWSGGGTVNLAENAVLYLSNSDTSDADDSTSFAYGPGGSMFANFTAGHTKRVNIGAILPTDIFLFEMTTDGGITWQPNNSAGWLEDYNTQNGTEYGVLLYPANATQYEVYFSQYRLATNAFGAAGENYSAIANNPQYKWRLRKVSQNAALGFKEATENSTGLAGPASANFTPGILGSSNIDGVSNIVFMYSKNGPIVTCTFYADVDANTVGPAYFDFTLPIASNFAAATDLIGNGSNLFDQRVSIFGAPAPNTGRMSFTALVLTATTWVGSFQYEVLP